MRYAVVSDIHSNIEALTEVLKEIDRRAVDQIICLGDMVGYYANPRECLQIIRERNMLSIAGNHDRAATGLSEPIASCGISGRRAILWTKPRLTSEETQFLDQLPIIRTVNQQFLIVHASLYPEPNEETYLTANPELLQKNFEALIGNDAKVKICFFGHTHHPVVYRFYNGSVIKSEPTEVLLNTSDYFLINPGSVGYSRDKDPRASFLIYDTNENKVFFYRIAYDRAACLKKAERAGLIYKERIFRSFVARILDQIGIKDRVKRLLRPRP